MNRTDRRIRAKLANARATSYPARLTSIPREDWPTAWDAKRVAVWISRRFLVQVFDEPPVY